MSSEGLPSPRRSRRSLALAVLVLLLVGAGAFAGWLVHERRPHVLEGAASAPVQWLGFSPSGKTLAVATEEPLVRLWDWRDGRLERLLAPSVKLRRARLRKGQVAFSGDERWLAVAFTGEPPRILDLATGLERVLPDTSPDGRLLAFRDGLVALDREGRLLAVDLDEGVDLWRLPDMLARLTLGQPEPASGGVAHKSSTPPALALSRGGDLVARASGGTFSIRSLRTGAVLADRLGNDDVIAIAPETGGGFLVARASSDTGRVSVTVTREPGERDRVVMPLPPAAGDTFAEVEQLSLSASGELLAVSRAENAILSRPNADPFVLRTSAVLVFSVRDARLLATLPCPGKPRSCKGLALSPDDGWIATTWDDDPDVRIERLPR